MVAVAAAPTLNELLERDREDAWARFDEMSGVYARELRRLSREAASRLHRHQWTRPLTAAGEPADWVIPDPDELINLAKAAGELDGKTRKLREQIAETSIGGTLAAYGLSFNLRNPTINNVITQMGQHITRIVEDQRRAIMESLHESWEQGLSIREASRAMIRSSIVESRVRGDMIARTELTGATSGGSLAAVRLINDASPQETRLVKIWIATNDERTRDSHAEASDDYGPGSGIPATDPFIIGGAPLDHPGDPSGPPEEVINCRCTIGYEQGVGGVPTAPAAEEPLPPPPIESVPPPEPIPAPGTGIATSAKDGAAMFREGLTRMGADAEQADEGAANWARRLRGRVDTTADTAEKLRTAAAENDALPLVRAAQRKYGRDRVIPIKPDAKPDALIGDPEEITSGKRITGPGVTFIYKVPDQPLIRDAVAQADSPSSLSWGGIGATLRHEYGHTIWEALTKEERRDFAKLLPATADERRNLSTYAASYLARGQVDAANMETFCEGFATISAPTFDAAEFAPWVRDVDRWIADHLTPERSAADMARDLIGSASREEPQATHDLSTIVRANRGEMGGLQFRLKTEKSLSGKLERKAREKGVTPEEYSKSVADVLRYTGVFKPGDYARGVEQTIERLRAAGYKISDSDVENYWATGDDYNGINATAVTPSGYRFELQFHTQESLDLKNGELHRLYEQFRDEQNPHERYRLWTRMVDLSNSISQPDEAALRIGTRTVHKPPALPETPEELARSLIESAQRRDEQVTGDLRAAIGANLGRMEGLEFRVKGHDSLVRKLVQKGPLDPVAYSTKVADVLRYTGVFEPADYDPGVQRAINALRDAGYRIDESDIENYWQAGDDYNGININVQTADGYRFELQFHTPESFALKNGELHRLYEEYRVSTDPFIRRALWDQMVNLSDNLQTRMDLKVIMNVRKIGTLASHEPPIAATMDEIDAVTHFDKYLTGEAAEALDRYTGISYDDINAYLRTGDLKINRHTGEYEYLGTMPESTSAEAKATRLRQVEAWINNMKDTFLPAEKPFIAYRGFRKAVLTDKYGANANLKNLVGKTISDRGFVSVSADQRIAEGFGSSEQSVVMELAVPKGMPTLNANRAGTGNAFEQEILLPPGSRFVIQSIRQPRKPGPFIIRAIVEPPNG